MVGEGQQLLFILQKIEVWRCCHLHFPEEKQQQHNNSLINYLGGKQTSKQIKIKTFKMSVEDTQARKETFTFSQQVNIMEKQKKTINWISKQQSYTWALTVLVKLVDLRQQNLDCFLKIKTGQFFLYSLHPGLFFCLFCFLL